MSASDKLSILEVEQENAVAVTDDVYVKIGSTFRRVPVSALLSHVLNSTGVCSTAAATADKAVSISGYSLYDGARAIVKFTYDVPSSATLNISSTGAKALRYNGAAINAGVLQAGCTALIVYDGTYHVVVAVDNQYIMPSGGIPENALADAVQAKLNAGGAQFISLTYYDGEYYPDTTSAAIYTALQSGDVDYILVDPAGRHCVLVSPPDNALTGQAVFGSFDAANSAIVLHTFASGSTEGYIVSTSVSIPAAATWSTIKPSGGVPSSDLAAGSNAKWGIGVATCSTVASTAAKEASLTDYELVKDGFVAVRFSNAVPANATLSINSKTAKSIYFNGSAISANVIRGGDIATFVYDGTYYQLVSILPAGANLVSLSLSGTTVTLQMSFAEAYNIFTAPWQTYMLLEVDTNVVLLMRPSKVDAANNQIYAEAAVGSTLYTVTLTQAGGNSYMTGTLTQTSISGGSGADTFEIEFDITSSTPTCDQDFSDIAAAAAAGKVILPTCGIYRGIMGDVSSSLATFYFFDYLASVPSLYILTVTSSDVVTLTAKTIGEAVVTDSSASPSSLAAQADTIYKYTASAVTALTISSFPSSGDFSVSFTSGSTATVLTLPQTLEDRMPSDFAVAANTRYEINVSDGWPLVASWAVSTGA